MSVNLDRSAVLSKDSGFPQQYNWLPRYCWNIIGSGVKHYYPNPGKKCKFFCKRFRNIIINSDFVCTVSQRCKLLMANVGMLCMSKSPKHLSNCQKSAEKCFVLIVLNDIPCPRSYWFWPSLCNFQVQEKHYLVHALINFFIIVLKITKLQDNMHINWNLCKPNPEPRKKRNPV